MIGKASAKLVIHGDLYQGVLEVDVQTRRDGNSAILVADVGDTRVYFGRLHAQVLLRDIGVLVTMNPDEGEWQNPGWARARAMDVIQAPDLLPLVLIELVKLHTEMGRKAGRKELSRELRTLIGVDPSDYRQYTFKVEE